MDPILERYVQDPTQKSPVTNWFGTFGGSNHINMSNEKTLVVWGISGIYYPVTTIPDPY